MSGSAAETPMVVDGKESSARAEFADVKISLLTEEGAVAAPRYPAKCNIVAEYDPEVSKKMIWPLELELIISLLLIRECWFASPTRAEEQSRSFW